MRQRLSYVLILPLIIAMLIPIGATPALAAIPCLDQEALPAPSGSTTQEPEGPRTLEDMLSGPESSPNGASTPTPDDIGMDGGNAIQGATENLVRCLLYRDYERFSTLVTGEYRVNNLGAITPEETGENIADVDALILLDITSTWTLPDGRQAGNVELLVNGDRLLLATLVFVERAGSWYLDDSSVTSATDIDTQVSVTLHPMQIDPRWLEAESEDVVSIRFNNETEGNFHYEMTRLDGDIFTPLSDRLVMGQGSVGPPDDSVLVLHDLEPGRYRITFTPDAMDEGAILSLEVMLTGN